MHVQRMVAICGVSIGVAGCAIRPLPQDVTGHDTYQIVSKVRCETREAIRGYAVEAIRGRHPSIAEEIETRKTEFRDLDRRRLAPDLQRVLERYDDAVIAYEFTFNIKENNNFNAGLGVLGTFTRGVARIGLAGANDRERQNTRNFRVYDTFENLISIVPERYCPNGTVGPNWSYPIVGSLGLSELIGTFLDLNQSGNLGGPKGGEEIPTISDTIQFTTKVSASVNPVVEISPLGRGLELTGANFKAENIREDIHQLIVVLTLPKEVRVAARGPAFKARTIAEQRHLAEFELERQRAISEGFVTRDLRNRLRQITE